MISLFLFSTQALAHTTLKSSTPSEGQILTQSINEVTLNFGAKVEQTSTLEVLKTNGEAVSLQSVSTGDDLMTGIFQEPLENGEYLVKWKIIGADGHPINGEYSFTIETAEQAAEEVEVENVDTSEEKVDQSQVQTNQMLWMKK